MPVLLQLSELVFKVLEEHLADERIDGARIFRTDSERTPLHRMQKMLYKCYCRGGGWAQTVKPHDLLNHVKTHMEWSETKNLHIYICNICSFREYGLKNYIMHLVGAHIKRFVQCHRCKRMLKKEQSTQLYEIHRHCQWPMRSSSSESSDESVD